MNRALVKKFAFAYAIFALLGYIMIVTLGANMTRSSLVAQAGQKLYDEAINITNSQKQSIQSDDIKSVYDALCILAKYQKSYIWMISPSGDVIVDTDKEFSSSPSRKIKDFEPYAINYQVGDFFGCFNKDVLSAMAPINYQMKLRGYVAIHTDMDEIDAQCDHMMNMLFVIFAIIFLLSLLILGLFFFMVYRPLGRITNGASEFAAGNLTYKIPVLANDEMGYLASTLNYMASELSQTEEYQRNFVANVSHDFRSPLTSIKGYAEAILDGTIPVESQDKYLKIITFETERLTKLTESLLVLNDMEKGYHLIMTNFDINSVIKSTAATFEVLCRKKKISIELVFEDKVQIVHADMSKIQQVLYNLIDNAIKFSRRDSVINVESIERYGKVYVSVKDHGCGIPSDSLGKIWDRFYKIDKSRGKDRKGTGLGLSIVKEIISAHEQTINVISTQGVGTEFLFSLDTPNKAKQSE